MSAMKVLFVASEAAPFFKSGGLGDVAGSLPAKLAAGGAQVSAVMPLYSAIGEAWRSRMRFVTQFDVPLAWRRQYCGVFEMQMDGVTWYFLDNEYYFKRPGAYGQFDDGERFAFFSKAVLEMAWRLNEFPDVVHCNDWQTALVPVYLKTHYASWPEYRAIRTVYTIHNIQYQGQYDMATLSDVFALEPSRAGLVEYHDMLNLTKGAIVCCDRLTTVSPTYAAEILTDEVSHGLGAILRENRYKLQGILNGIDTTSYDPAQDKAIFAPYSAQDPAAKAVNKRNLQQMLELPVNDKVPVIGLVSRLVDHKGLDLISAVIDQLLDESLQLVVLGTGDWRYVQQFLDLQSSYPNKVSANIAFSDDLARKIYAGSDLFLMPSLSEPCGLSQLIALRYGAIPVVRETGGLADTIRSVGDDGEGGNGFSFAPYSGQDMLYTIRRALAFYRDTAKWEKLTRTAMACDFSWNESAKEYLEIYHKLSDGGK